MREVLAVAAAGDLCLRTAAGELLPLPESVHRVLAEATTVLARGDALTLVPPQAELSTTQAAALLGVSRPQLIKLLATQAIPYRRVGSHRRVSLLDLQAYAARRHAKSLDLLNAMAHIAEESAGGYD